jgi:hypothetical protein
LYKKTDYEDKDTEETFRIKPKLTSSKSIGNTRAHLDEEFFLIE